MSATPERQTLVSLAQPTPKVSGLAGPEAVLSGGRRGARPFFLSWTLPNSWIIFIDHRPFIDVSRYSRAKIFIYIHTHGHI